MTLRSPSNVRLRFVAVSGEATLPLISANADDVPVERAGDCGVDGPGAELRPAPDIETDILQKVIDRFRSGVSPTVSLNSRLDG